MNRSLRTSRHERDDRGVIALEMILALPILLMLIIGVVVLGNALSVKTRTMGYAHHGAREAALGKDLPVIDGVTFAFDGPACPTPRDSTESVTVMATMPINLRNIPFLPAVLPAEISETVTMRCGG